MQVCKHFSKCFLTKEFYIQWNALTLAPENVCFCAALSCRPKKNFFFHVLIAKYAIHCKYNYNL